MAIGPNAKASSVKALAIGNNVSASGTLSIAIGTASNPSTDTTTAETPHPTSSEGTSSVAIGTSAIAQTANMGNKNIIENGTAGAYTQIVKQIAVVGSGNTVKGNTDINTTTWGTVQRDTILGYGNTIDATKQSTPVSNLQILGNDVTATLGNSVYLGTGSSATASKSATAEAIQLAKDQGDTEALASDEYKNAATDEAQNAITQKYEAKYIHAANIAAMDKDGTSAGVTNYDTDYTYGNDSTYNYAGSQADGVVTVGSKDATRRIQNVSAGLIGPNSTDAVNGSQLYALTRQIRFGGDNSTFGKTTAADDQNVVARGSNETISITGGSDAVTSSTTDGTTTYTVDAAKLTGNNIAVVADKDANALHVQLASNLKDLNTAQLGSGNGESYKETIKLDGTGTSGGQMTLASADGTVKTTLDTTGITIANGPKFTSSGIDAANQQINHVTAGTDDTDAANVGQVKAAARTWSMPVSPGRWARTPATCARRRLKRRSPCSS